jgi:hypothetical protein
MPQQSARRQARFLSDQVILPEGLEPGRWYDVLRGRRHDDERPGMVLLDLGTRRVHVPVSCLEFRVPQPAPAPAPVAPTRRWKPKHVLAASLVPLGLVAMVAVGAIAVDAG